MGGVEVNMDEAQGHASFTITRRPTQAALYVKFDSKLLFDMA
jgi:hypothetical protein